MQVYETDRGQAATPVPLSEHEGLIRMVAWRYMPYTNAIVDMDDLMQAGRIGVMLAKRTYQPDKGAFSSWAVFYIRNEMRRALRHNYNHELSLDAPMDEEGATFAEFLPDPDADTAAPAEAEGFRGAIIERVNALPDELERQAIHLCFLEELTRTDAARCLGISYGRLNMAFNKALRHLRRDRRLKKMAYWE